MTQYVAAIDQGTTSTRCMIFDHSGQVVAVDQIEHQQIFPKAGWVEHDAAEIWINTRQVCGGALASADLDASSTSPRSASPTSARPRSSGTSRPASRSTTPSSGRTRAPRPICDELGALGGGPERYKAKAGLPAGHVLLRAEGRGGSSTTSTAPASGPRRGDLLFGNMDTWVLWNITGGAEGGVHVTDPTNASRTLLMDLDTLSWDPEHRRRRWGSRCRCCRRSGRRRRSTARSGPAARSRGVPVAGILGDQQAATFGQACLAVGEAKNTYGTGNFVLLNTGTEQVRVEERPADDGLLQDRRRTPRSTRSRARSPSPARWCSGCATTSA